MKKEINNWTSLKEDMYKYAEALHAESDRNIMAYLDVLTERYRSDISAVVELVKENSRKLDACIEMIASMKVEVEVLKTDMKEVTSGLKKKVDHKDLILLKEQLQN